VKDLREKKQGETQKAINVDGFQSPHANAKKGYGNLDISH